MPILSHNSSTPHGVDTHICSLDRVSEIFLILWEQHCQFLDYVLWQEKMASILGENSDISYLEGFTEEDLADKISVVPDSDPYSSDIEVSSVGSSDISDFGECEDENAENLNVNSPHSTWKMNFGNVTVDPFEQDSGPKLPENFDVSAATLLNFFELLFKPEMFREIVIHAQTIMLS